jgi:small-conductance mechanosensitive channel
MVDESFEREDDVRAWMRQLAAVPIDGRNLPDARQLWWKAKLLKRWDAERRVIEPIEWAETVQVSLSVAGALILLAWLWRSTAVPSSLLTFATVVGLTLLVAAGSLTLRRS